MQQLKDYISSIQFDCKRGRYDARQVDEFIASVLEQVNTLEQQINALKEENARYESQSASMAAAMITAEKNCAEMLEQAKAQPKKRARILSNRCTIGSRIWKMSTVHKKKSSFRKSLR